VREHPDRVDYVESFGQLGYLSAMSHASVVAGNSSSIVLEAPVLGTPSVLVGDRQKGRPIAGSVWVPRVQGDAIATALREALSSGRGPAGAELFGSPGFAERARDMLLSTELPRPPRKAFHDLKTGERP
jgi:UDP-N-acetylglucosamine 2-epimerase